MASFSYVALEQSGKQKKGMIDAANEEAAKNALKAEGLIPVSVEVPNALNKEFNFTIGKKVKARDLSVFCKQFGSILHAGVTVIQALQMMVDQTQNKYLRTALSNTAKLVEKGETLSDAMRQQDGIFPDILLNMTEAGEASGSLETSMERMAVQFEKDNKTASMIKNAMIYPCVLLVVIIGVVALMLIKIIPGFEETFAEADTELPGITKAVMAMSHALIHWWWLVAAIIIAIVVLFKIALKTEQGAMIWGRLVLKTPLVGDLSAKSAAARLARTLSTLMSSGIPMVNAIEIVAKIMGNAVIKAAMNETKTDVERGVPLSQPLEASGVFPPLLYNMCAIGEETGNMEEMLTNAAEFYEEEVENATKAVMAVLEPCIILVMAAVVVPIMMAIMAPMLAIYQAAENG